MNFKNWVKSIQTAGYNGARTVYKIGYEFLKSGIQDQWDLWFYPRNVIKKPIGIPQLSDFAEKKISSISVEILLAKAGGIVRLGNFWSKLFFIIICLKNQKGLTYFG